MLQRTIGLRAAQRMLGIPSPFAGPIQAKLTVGPAGDQYEQEADRVAKQVVAAPAPAAPIGQRNSGVEEELQTSRWPGPSPRWCNARTILNEDELMMQAWRRPAGRRRWIRRRTAHFEERLNKEQEVAARPCPKA